jgi:NAD-specific glutamate dehydrogenase
MNQLQSVSTATALLAGDALPLDLRFVVFDETRYYSAEIREKAGTVYQTYVYDANRAIHCCEITPSFTLVPFYTQAMNYLEDDAAREALDEVIRQANTEAEERYVHCCVVDRIPNTHKRKFHLVERDLDEEYQKQLDSVLDHLRGSPPMIAAGRPDCIII